jgi:hypothetical protein
MLSEDKGKSLLLNCRKEWEEASFGMGHSQPGMWPAAEKLVLH